MTFTAELTVEEEFQFLTRFRKAHAALRRLFPMLTDVVILSEGHLGVWSRFGIGGFEVRRWKILFGGTPACSYDDHAMGKDALDDALCRYDLMLAWYFKPASYLMSQQMQRIASRIFSLCAPRSARN